MFSEIFHDLIVKTATLKEFMSTLWKYKLWWSFPIILVLLLVMVLLFVAGHTGVAAIIYPIF
jgi:hypothetical protein